MISVVVLNFINNGEDFVNILVNNGMYVMVVVCGIVGIAVGGIVVTYEKYMKIGIGYCFGTQLDMMFFIKRNVVNKYLEYRDEFIGIEILEEKLGLGKVEK